MPCIPNGCVRFWISSGIKNRKPDRISYADESGAAEYFHLHKWHFIDADRHCAAKQNATRMITIEAQNKIHSFHIEMDACCFHLNAACSRVIVSEYLRFVSCKCGSSTERGLCAICFESIHYTRHCGTH